MTMSNRPYDVADAAVGTVGEDVPGGLQSNFDAYQANRANYFMSLQEQMYELAQTDTDLTMAPSEDPNVEQVQHGAQAQDQGFEMVDAPQWSMNPSYEMPDSPLPPHRSQSFALPPTAPLLALPAPTEEVTSPVETQTTPSALPGPSRGRKRTRDSDIARDMMRLEGWLIGSERATFQRQMEYDAWVSAGRPSDVQPSWRRTRR